MDSHIRANSLWLQIVPQWMSLAISPGAHVWVSLGYIPGNGIAEWEGVLICNFTNCQISLKSDCINNTSQNFFFPFPIHCLHILQPPHIFLKSLPQTLVQPLHPRQLRQKPKKLGSGRAWVRARKKLGQAQQRPLCHGSVGENGRNSRTSIC